MVDTLQHKFIIIIISAYLRSYFFREICAKSFLISAPVTSSSDLIKASHLFANVVINCELTAAPFFLYSFLSIRAYVRLVNCVSVPDRISSKTMIAGRDSSNAVVTVFVLSRNWSHNLYSHTTLLFVTNSAPAYTCDGATSTTSSTGATTSTSAGAIATASATQVAGLFDADSFVDDAAAAFLFRPPERLIEHLLLIGLGESLLQTSSYVSSSVSFLPRG